MSHCYFVSFTFSRSQCMRAVCWLGEKFSGQSVAWLFFMTSSYFRERRTRERERKKRRNVAMLYGDFSIWGFESANGHRKTWSFHLIREKKRRWHHGTGIYITNLRVKSQRMVVIVHICIFHIITNRCVFFPGCVRPQSSAFRENVSICWCV